MREPERMSDDELKNLARQYVQGQIYIPRNEHALDCSFGAMLALCDWTDHDTSKIGLIFEEMHKAGPMAVNGYPMFLSLRMLHIEDSPVFLDHSKRMLEALA